MANLLEARTHWCKNGHDVRDKDATLRIRNDGTVICRKCRADYARRYNAKKQRIQAKAQNKVTKPIAPSKPVEPAKPQLSDVVVEIVNILHANPDLEVPTLISLSKAVRNK